MASESGIVRYGNDSPYLSASCDLLLPSSRRRQQLKQDWVVGKVVSHSAPIGRLHVAQAP